MEARQYIPMKADFKKDLSKGEKAELWVLERLREYYPDLKKRWGQNKGYDFYSEESKITIEVKAIWASEKYGGIAIEYERESGPSGISITTPDFYCIIYYDKDASRIFNGFRKDGLWCWTLFPTKELKDICEWDCWKTKECHDKYHARMKIIPVLDFTQYVPNEIHYIPPKKNS